METKGRDNEYGVSEVLEAIFFLRTEISKIGPNSKLISIKVSKDIEQRLIATSMKYKDHNLLRNTNRERLLFCDVEIESDENLPELERMIEVGGVWFGQAQIKQLIGIAAKAEKLENEAVRKSQQLQKRVEELEDVVRRNIISMGLEFEITWASQQGAVFLKKNQIFNLRKELARYFFDKGFDLAQKQIDVIGSDIGKKHSDETNFEIAKKIIKAKFKFVKIKEIKPGIYQYSDNDSDYTTPDNEYKNLATRYAGEISKELLLVEAENKKLLEAFRRIRHHVVGFKSNGEILSEIDEALGEVENG